MLKLQGVETTTQALGSHLAPSGFLFGFLLGFLWISLPYPCCETPVRLGKAAWPEWRCPLPRVNASQLPAGFMLGLLLGLLRVSLPYLCRVAPAWLGRVAWPEWRFPQPSSPGYCRESLGFPVHPEAWFCLCILALSSYLRFNLLFPQRFLFLTNRKRRFSWINSALVCLTAVRRSAEKKDTWFFHGFCKEIPWNYWYVLCWFINSYFCLDHGCACAQNLMGFLEIGSPFKFDFIAKQGWNILKYHQMIKVSSQFVIQFVHFGQLSLSNFRPLPSRGLRGKWRKK